MPTHQGFFYSVCGINNNISNLTFAQKISPLCLNFDLKFFFHRLDFDSIFDSFGSKVKSQNYSTRPDSTANGSGGS